MKRLFVFLIALIFTFPVYSQSWTNAENGVDILYMPIDISLSKAATNYSWEIALPKYVAYDSSSYLANVEWQSNDTVQATITLETKNSIGSGSWTTAGTLVTNQLNAGNDTLYAKTILERGTIPSGVLDMVTLGSKLGDKMRVKVVFGNPTTVGNSGTFKLWVYLKKK